MAKASDNVFPKLIVAEGATPASPAAGQQKLFVDSADHKLKRINSAGAVTTVEGGGSGATTVATPPQAIFATTFDNTEMMARFMISRDGGLTFAWLDNYNPYSETLNSTIGVRDASIVHFNGRYVMAYTRATKPDYLGTSQTNWGLATSNDGLNWTYFATITPSTPSGINKLYAPDLFVNTDGTLWAYYSCSTDGGTTFVPYCTSTTDMNTWTTPTQVTGSGIPSPKAIDATVRKIGNQYAMVIKDDTALRIYLGWASAPQGPYTVSTTALPTAAENVEGPSLVPIPGGWRLYYDAYTADALRYMDSFDGLATWSSPVTVTRPATNLRHPGIMPVSDADAAILSGPPFAGRVINAQTGTAYTLVYSDRHKHITMSNAAASTLTIPPDSSVNFPIGTVIEGSQEGGGQVTLTPGTGVTLHGSPGLKVADQYSWFAIKKIGNNTWSATGRLSA